MIRTLSPGKTGRTLPKPWIGQSERQKIDPKHLAWVFSCECLAHCVWFILHIHQILPTAFNSIRLLGVRASKSVFLLHNTAPYVDGEVLSTIQIHLATPAVHLRTFRWVPYLEPVPFMDFVFLLTLWMPDSVQKAMWIFVLTFFFL